MPAAEALTEPRYQAADLRPLIEALDRTIAEYDKAIRSGKTVTSILLIERSSLRTMRETLAHLIVEEP